MAYTAGTLSFINISSPDVAQISGDMGQITDVSNTGNLHVFALPDANNTAGTPFCIKNETASDVIVQGRFSKTPAGTWRTFTVYAGTWSIERVVEVQMSDGSAFLTGLKYGIR